MSRMIACPGAAPARDHALDGLRVVALLFVIVIHIGAKGFGLLGQNWWAINLYESVARIAVPLFFMISGALLLPREHGVATIGKRAWRIGLPLLAWSLLYLGWFRYTGQRQSEWLGLIVAGPVVAHLWYLYALLGLYLFLPVLAPFFRTNPVRVQVFCLVFWFIAASLVPLEVALTGRIQLGIQWTALPLYAGYMAAGALLYHHLPAVPRPPVLAGAWIGWVVCAAATALGTWWRVHTLARPDETFWVYSSPTVLLAALAAFVCLRALFAARVRPDGRLGRCIGFFAGASFGIYLVHVLVLFFLDGHGIDYRFINPWLAIPLLTLGVATVSALLVSLLQAIPLVRSIVPQ